MALSPALGLTVFLNHEVDKDASRFNLITTLARQFPTARRRGCEMANPCADPTLGFSSSSTSISSNGATTYFILVIVDNVKKDGRALRD